MAQRKAAKRKSDRKPNSGNGANLGFEATLWAPGGHQRPEPHFPIATSLGWEQGPDG